MFVEVIGKKAGKGGGLSPILNRVKIQQKMVTNEFL